MTDTPAKEWWSAAELADARLPDLPTTKRKINQRAEVEGWAQQAGKARQRKARGGGVEYHYTVLPMRARLALLAESKAPEPKRLPEDAWSDFEGLSSKAKAKAEARLLVMQEVAKCEAAGMTRTEAVRAVVASADASEKTVWNWISMIEGVSAADWLAYLAPRNRGSKARSTPVDPEFWALLKSAWLQPEGPDFTACYEWVSEIAKKEGLAVPPIWQVRRKRDKEISKPTEIYWRKGAEALRRYYPHQDRDKSAMTALECVCGDYHKFDVFVRWPGEALPVRPQGVFFSDIYSGKLLSYRLSLTPNSHTVQLTIGDLVERYGIPQNALLDNGREFAAKALTGGTETRFRFKIREDDIPGLLPKLDVNVIWATPYSGQSKPIERAFRDLCSRVAKHPAFSGAYTGNRPDAKPENYGSAAIPLAEFEEVLAKEVDKHNARPGRRSEVAYGRSFDEVFNASYEANPIRKATAEQRRMWLLRAEGVRANAKNGEIKIMGSRFWAEWMYQIAGQKVVACFDPDNLHKDLHVYSMDGPYIGAAECVERGEFLSVEDAREVARKRNKFIKSTRESAKAEQEYSAAEIAARLRAAGEDVQSDELPEANVIQMATPHERAPQPTRQVRSVSDVSGGNIARLDDLRDRAPTEETPEAKYERAVALEQAMAEGRAVSQEQQAWLAGFQKSAQYRAQKRLREAFGG